MRFTFVCFALLAGALATTAAIPLKSVPKSPIVPAKVVPESQTKVENYVSVLKKDLEAQEATLRGYVSKVEVDRGSKQKQLVSLTAIMNHLHEQLLNTTKYYHEYNRFVGDVQAKIKPLTLEYDRANALYTQTRTKLNEEKKFLDTLVAYIKTRQAQKC
jgi:chromosome segregation ATPase